MTTPDTVDKWTNKELKAISEPLVKKFKEISQKLTVIKDRSAWHKKEHTALTKRATTAAEDMKKLKTLSNKPKDDKANPVDPKELVAEVDAILAGLNTALAKKPTVTYYYGKSKVGGQQAIETKVKAALPSADQKFASQAVTDAVNGTNLKDAAVAGKGVKHASAGTPKVGSCTVFFTFDEYDEGLERRFVVVAVGSHAGASSYTIHETFTTKLKVGGKPTSL